MNKTRTTHNILYWGLYVILIMQIIIYFFCDTSIDINKKINRLWICSFDYVMTFKNTTFTVLGPSDCCNMATKIPTVNAPWKSSSSMSYIKVCHTLSSFSLIDDKSLPGQPQIVKRLPTCSHEICFKIISCVFCCISLLFAYMCMHMPSSPRTIAGVPSGRALPRFPGARQAEGL